MARRRRIDLSRVAESALDAAVNGGEQPRRNRFSGVRAVAAGAALAAAAQIVARKAPTPRIPGLAQLPDLSDLGDRLRDGLAERGWLEDDERVEEDFDDELDEPVGEEEEHDEEPEDEDFDDGEGEDEDDGGRGGDEDDRGPQAEGDEDEWDEEDVPDEEEEEPDSAASEDVEEAEPVEGNGRHRRAAEAPDLMGALSPHGSPPPLRLGARGEAPIDPAARPPEPPKRKTSKAKAGAS